MLSSSSRHAHLSRAILPGCINSIPVYSVLNQLSGPRVIHSKTVHPRACLTQLLHSSQQNHSMGNLQLNLPLKLPLNLTQSFTLLLRLLLLTAALRLMTTTQTRGLSLVYGDRRTFQAVAVLCPAAVARVSAALMIGAADIQNALKFPLFSFFADHHIIIVIFFYCGAPHSCSHK